MWKTLSNHPITILSPIVAFQVFYFQVLGFGFFDLRFQNAEKSGYAQVKAMCNYLIFINKNDVLYHVENCKTNVLFFLQFSMHMLIFM